MARPKINIIEITHYIHHDPVIDPVTGEIIVPAWDEPVYEAITREMNDEEYEAYEREQAEEEARRRQEPPSEMEKLSAQVLYTAVCTDSLIEEV